MAPRDILISDATKLPGAFLILTVKPTNPTGKSVTRWDQEGLPYREDFSDDGMATFGPQDYYSGVFGRNKSTYSQAWPWKDMKNHPMQNGIAIAFWNQNTTQRGLFTNAYGQRFNKKSKTSIMSLTDGKSKELLTPGEKDKLPEVQSITLEYYAMQNRGTTKLD